MFDIDSESQAETIRFHVVAAVDNLIDFHSYDDYLDFTSMIGRLVLSVIDPTMKDAWRLGFADGQGNKEAIELMLRSIKEGLQSAIDTFPNGEEDVKRI